MSVSLYSVTFARALLLIQLVIFVAIGALFALKDITWGISALAGGTAAWLPNVLFVLLVWRLEAKTPIKGKIAWGFAFGEAAKIVATIILLVVASGIFRAALWPLGLTWLSVLLIQIVAPAVINKKG